MNIHVVLKIRRTMNGIMCRKVSSRLLGGGNFYIALLVFLSVLSSCQGEEGKDDVSLRLMQSSISAPLSLVGGWNLQQAIRYQGAISADMAYDDMSFHFSSDSVSVLHKVTILYFDGSRDTTTTCCGSYPYHWSSNRCLTIDGETFDMTYSAPELILANDEWKLVLRKNEATLKDIP